LGIVTHGLPRRCSYPVMRCSLTGILELQVSVRVLKTILTARFARSGYKLYVARVIYRSSIDFLIGAKNSDGCEVVTFCLVGVA
jgi:hypothetical protein